MVSENDTKEFNERKEHPLHQAVKKDDFTTVCNLLMQGVNPDAKLEDGQTALHIVKDPLILELLIEHGANVNSTDDVNDTPLHYATSDVKLQMVEILLTAGANPNIFNKSHYTALLIGLESSSQLEERAQITEMLLANDADPNIYTRFTNTTPLYNAVKFSNYNAAILLINAGATLNGNQGEGGSPLDIATASGDLKMIELLQESGGGSYLLKADLLQALYELDRIVINEVLQKETDLNFQFDEIGLTPLQICIKYVKDTELTALFINSGADVNLEDTTNLQAALHFAINETSSPEMINMLLEHGANINHQDIQENTPLMLAASIGNLEIVEILLENEANTEIKTEDGKQAADLALAAGFEAVSALILAE